MNKKSKILSAFVTVIMVLLSFGSVVAFADGEQYTADMKLEIKSNSSTVMEGASFKVGVKFNFSQGEIETAGGIRVYRFGLRFDPRYLEILDPETLESVEAADDGEAVNGSFFSYGSIGAEGSLSAAMNKDGRTLVLLYGSSDDNNDIFEPGIAVNFAFRAKSDLVVDGSISTDLEIINPEIVTVEKNTKLVISSENLNMKITPPFTIPGFGGQRQNTTLEVNGKSIIDKDSSEPLMAKIVQGDKVFGEEKQAELSDGTFSVSFELDEKTYPVGDYDLVMTHGESIARRSFEVTEKDKTPDPAEPADPKPDTPTDSGDTKKDDNNTGGGTHSDGNKNNGTSNTGSTTTPTKPSNTADSGNKPQTTVKYPSDLAGHWAEPNVKYVYDNALMNGYSDGTFKPDASITRAEFSAVMARFLKLDDKAAATEKFGDVKGHWAIGYIGALADKGIVGGVTEDSFAPDDNITREQMAAILARAFELKETSPELFADNGEISDWAHDYVYACRKAGYMTGDAANNFSPLDNASRAEVATVIYRLHSAK